MLTKRVLSPQDIAGLVAAVFEYNQRGAVNGLVFYDADGRAVNLGYVEVACDEPGLAVRTLPEPTAAELAAKVSKMGVPADPTKVEPPAPMAELAATMEAK